MMTPYCISNGGSALKLPANMGIITGGLYHEK